MAVLLFSCNKPKHELKQDCADVLVISYKYKSPKILVKIDTLYSAYICDRWLDTMRNQKDEWFMICQPSYFEYELLKTIVK